MVTVDLVAFESLWLDVLVPMWRESFEAGVGVIDSHPLADQRRYFLDDVLPQNSVRLALHGDGPGDERTRQHGPRHDRAEEERRRIVVGRQQPWQARQARWGERRRPRDRAADPPRERPLWFREGVDGAVGPSERASDGWGVYKADPKAGGDA